MEENPGTKKTLNRSPRGPQKERKPSLNRSLGKQRKQRQKEKLSGQHLPLGARPESLDKYGSSKWKGEPQQTQTFSAPSTSSSPTPPWTERFPFVQRWKASYAQFIERWKARQKANPNEPTLRDRLAEKLRIVFEKMGVWMSRLMTRLGILWERSRTWMNARFQTLSQKLSEKLSGPLERLRTKLKAARELSGKWLDKGMTRILGSIGWSLDRISEGLHWLKARIRTELSKIPLFQSMKLSPPPSERTKEPIIPEVATPVAPSALAHPMSAVVQFMKAIVQPLETRNVFFTERLDTKEYGVQFIQQYISSGHYKQPTEPLTQCLPLQLQQEPLSLQAQWLLASQHYVPYNQPALIQEELDLQLFALSFSIGTQHLQQHPQPELALYALYNMFALHLTEPDTLFPFIEDIRQKWSLSTASSLQRVQHIAQQLHARGLFSNTSLQRIQTGLYQLG